MDFDASSAEPVAAVAEPEFDSASAVPVKSLAHAADSGETLPGMEPGEAANLKDLSRGSRTEGSFQQKFIEPAAAATLEPAVKIPDVPDINVPGVISGGVASGVMRGVKSIAESLTAPIGAVLAPLAPTSAVSPIAKTIIKAAEVYFAGETAKSGGAEAANLVEKIQDPNSTASDVAESATKAIGALGFSGTLAAHAAPKFSDHPVTFEAQTPDGKTIQVETTAGRLAEMVKEDQPTPKMVDIPLPKDTVPFDPASATPLQTDFQPESAQPVTAENLAIPQASGTLTKARNVGDTIFMSFDATKSPPDISAIKDAIEKAGYNASVIQHEIGFQHVATGETSMVIKGLTEDGRNSSEVTNKIYREVFGLNDVVNEPSTIQLGHGLKERLSKVSASLANAPVESPAPEIKVNVLPDTPHPTTGEIIPGFVQFDEQANAQGQPMPEAQRVALPDPKAILDAGIPKGEYTLDEINAQLAKSEPSGKFTISMKNAAIDAERVARGEEPILQQAAQGDQEIWDKATKAIDENPGVVDEIVNRHLDSPDVVSAEEQAILFQRKIDLKNQFDESTKLIDTGTLSPEDQIIERDKRARLLDEINAVEEVSNKAGSETGRALRYRQLAANEDYTLSSLMAKESAAKGRRLTLDEENQIAMLSRQLSEAQAKLAEKEQELIEKEAPKAPPKRSRIVQVLSDRADAARERIKARLASGQVSAGIDPALIKDIAEIGAYHLARGIEKTAEWSAEIVKEFGEKIVPHLAAIRSESEKIRAAQLAEETAATKLKAVKTRKMGDIVKFQNKITLGELEPQKRAALAKDAEYNRLQARYEQLKAEAAARLEKARFEKLSLLGKAREMAVNTYDAARNIMTTGEFSFILRQGKFAALSHPIITAKTVPSAFRALFTDEVGARAIDLETMNQPEMAAARAAKLHIVDEGAKLSRQEEIFASKWAENIPIVRNFNQAGRVFLNKLRFDVWKTLRQSVDATTPAQDAVLAKFVNEATGRGTLGGAEPAAVALGRAFFSPRYLASRVQLLVGHSMWGGDLTTRRIIAKEYAKALVGLGLYYTLLAQMKDKNGKPATIEKDPRSSDFGKVKLGNTRLDPLAGLAQVIVFGARTATLERKDSKGRVQSLQSGKFGAPKWSDVAANFARSKLHPVPGAIINLFNGTDLGGNPATVQNQALNLSMPLTYMDVYQALEEQDLPEGVALSLLTMLGDGLQTYDTSRKRPKPPTKK